MNPSLRLALTESKARAQLEISTKHHCGRALEACRETIYLTWRLASYRQGGGRRGAYTGDSLRGAKHRELDLALDAIESTVGLEMGPEV